MKKSWYLLVGILLHIVFLFAMQQTTVAAFVYPDGDVAPFGQRDAQVNAGDALLCLRFALNLETPTEEDIAHGDCAPLNEIGQPNPDEKITVGDALVILRRALGMVHFFTYNVSKDSLEFSDFYRTEPLQITAQVPSYSLPLQESDIDNFTDFSAKIPLDTEALELLRSNGFVVMDNPMHSSEEYMTNVYESLRYLKVPVFITTDSLLHFYHIQFDETLRIIEEKEFYDDIWEISKALFEDFITLHETSSSDLKEEAKRNAVFFAVALSLLEPKVEQVCRGDQLTCNNWETHFTEAERARYAFAMPASIQPVVEKELALIDAHEGFDLSPAFKYEEDYSQYAPRGHYTRSEKLKNYFRAFMWYGRISFLLKGDLIKSQNPAYEARLQTGQAALIVSELTKNESIKDKWDRIYSVTSFYVGTSDDLGPYEYLDAMRFVFGEDFSPQTLTEENIDQLKARLAEYRSPKIYGGTGNCVIPPPFTPEQAEECLEDTKGFRFMGQRFVPDSYMFSNLVGAYTDVYQGKKQPFTLVISGAGRLIRGFPRGLDVMALLGSDRAGQILDELDDANYGRYDEAFLALQDEFNAFRHEEWNKNLYFSWLYSLMALVKEFPAGYPSFMRNSAWLDKELTTALASWTELRHDTILYAKQSYTPVESGIPPTPPRVVGYVEPVPEFFNRLLALTRMTTEGLNRMEVLDEASQSRLKNLENILVRLVQVSKDELDNQELSDDDYDFINDFADHLAGVITDVEDKAKKTTIIADVHTDANTMQVLEEGVGYVKLIAVAYLVPDGRILIGAGPVMSYYEFKQPANSRLTDEAWRDMLQTNPPANVEWFSCFGI